MSSSTAIDEYQAVLARYGTVVDFDISALDRLGIPVTSCSLAVDGALRHHGNGYGATVDAARLSGLGELAEGVLSAAHLVELRRQSILGSRRDLVRSRGVDQVVDPRLLCLPAGSGYTESTLLEWVPVERLRTGAPVWVPMEFVVSETGELGGRAEPLIQPISNGLGAGLDEARPLAHGLLEILQRHTNGLRFRALDVRSPEVAPESLPPAVSALIDRLTPHGVRPVLKHAVSELGVCSTYVMGLDDDPGAGIRLTGCGEAAHPSAQVSLTKALLEYANSRCRKAFCFGDRAAARTIAPAAYWDALPENPVGELRAREAMARWAGLSTATLRTLTRPDRSTSIDYADIEVVEADVSAPEALLGHLLDTLSEHDVLTTRTRVGEVVVAKTVVSGLEVETLSYGRIGELGARQLLETDLDLVRRQDGPTEAHRDRIVLTAEAEERLGGAVWYSYAVADRLMGELYPLYREPPRHSVQVTGGGDGAQRAAKLNA